MIKLISATPVGDSPELDLKFSDGSYARWSAAYLIGRETVLTKDLADPTYFSRAFIESGALAWPNGLELSPVALHDSLAKKDAWLGKRHERMQVVEVSQWFRLLFLPENAAAVGAWGFIVGVLSAILGAIGFGITLYQVWKIKNAAQASSDAISSIKIRIGHLDLIQECAKAENALNSIRGHLIESKTEVPLSTFDALAISLVTINEGSRFLPAATRQRLANAISSINKLSVAPKSGDRTVTAKQAATVREYHGLLISIRTHVQEGQTA